MRKQGSHLPEGTKLLRDRVGKKSQGYLSLIFFF